MDRETMILDTARLLIWGGPALIAAARIAGIVDWPWWLIASPVLAMFVLIPVLTALLYMMKLAGFDGRMTVTDWLVVGAIFVLLGVSALQRRLNGQARHDRAVEQTRSQPTATDSN